MWSFIRSIASVLFSFAVLIIHGESNYQGAEEMRLARSVRQLLWVLAGRWLYAPAPVRIVAKTQIASTDITTGNRSKTGISLNGR